MSGADSASVPADRKAVQCGDCPRDDGTLRAYNECAQHMAHARSGQETAMKSGPDNLTAFIKAQREKAVASSGHSKKPHKIGLGAVIFGWNLDSEDESQREHGSGANEG